MKKVKLVVSEAERTIIVAALMAYGTTNIARAIVTEAVDPTNDGPEVEILRARP
jgi:hypothetical protein